MKITWLASFPKSGNTWVRFLIYHYYWGELTNTLDLNRRIPDVHRPGPVEQGMERVFLKTHFLRTEPKLAGHLARTERAIHIRRHPKDVLLSGLNFRRLAGTLQPDGPEGEKAFAREFIQNRADPNWPRFGFGTWEKHIESWTSASFPVLSLRYEDLKSDAEGSLREIIEFVGDEPDDARITQAVELSDFNRLRSIEVKEKKAGSQSLFRGGKESLDKDALFMNKGQSGQSIDHLGQEVVQAFDDQFGDLLREFGY